MELARVDLPGNKATIAFLGDIHEGSASHRADALAETIRQIRDGGWYYVLMGDLIDAIIAGGDPRFNPVEIAAKYGLRDLKDLPRRQAEEVLSHFDGIEDKCLAILCGNHEAEYIKRHAFNVYDYMATRFPRAHKLGYVGVLRVQMEWDANKHTAAWDIVLNHGDGGGGKTAGYIKNKITDLGHWFDCDAFIAGHLHRLEVASENYMRANHSMTKMQYRTKWLGMSGCYMDTFTVGADNYFSHKGRAPSDIGFLRMDLEIRTPRPGRAESWQHNMQLEAVNLSDIGCSHAVD